MILVLNRIWPARKSRAVSLDLPLIKTVADTVVAQAEIISAASSGEVSLDEAQTLGALVEGHRRVIETVEGRERGLAVPPTIRIEASARISALVTKEVSLVGG